MQLFSLVFIFIYLFVGLFVCLFVRSLMCNVLLALKGGRVVVAHSQAGGKCSNCCHFMKHSIFHWTLSRMSLGMLTEGNMLMLINKLKLSLTETFHWKYACG